MIAPQLFSLSKDFTRPKFDPDGAKKLLTEAGYPDGFEVTMDCPNDRYVNDAAICQAVVGMLARIGVKVDLLAQPKQQYFAKVLKPGGYKTSFFLLGWTPASLDSHNVLHDIMGCRNDPKDPRRGEANLGGYCNKKLDALTDKVLLESDTAKRDQLIKQAFEIGVKDLRLYPAASAGAGVGRIEEGEADPARGQPGPALLGDQTGIVRLTAQVPAASQRLPGLFFSRLPRHATAVPRSERNHMLAFTLRRAIQAIGVMIAVGIISFSMFRFAGDPVNQMVCA